MLQVEYRIKLGQDEFIIKADVKDEIEFFKSMSFYSNLPKVGPNGETDLKVTHRTTTQGYNYYSLVSEKAGQEFKFGQINDKDGGLYPKGWQPIYKGDNAEQAESSNGVGIGTSTGIGIGTNPASNGLNGAATPTTPQNNLAFAMPTPTAQPATQTNPNFPGLVNPTTGPSAAAPAPVPTAATPAPAPAANPQVAQVANDVLKRFGIAQPATR